MLFMECYVYRNKNGDLFLSIIPPITTKAGNMEVRYTIATPKHLRHRLPIAKPTNMADRTGTNKLRLRNHLFPDVNPMTYKKVILSILDAKGIEEYCDISDIRKEVLIHSR